MDTGLDSFLLQQAKLGLLRFLTCGSVDDGKSTLIGRLLHEAGQILDDQLATLEKDSVRHGTTGEEIDFALLVDGLEAEREQGITIDVAYRFFTTDRRRFMVADTPGHEQYTRNMATGAANAELAILLVDARHGLMTQTRRHAFVVSLMGIRHVVLAVNKIDLVEFSEARYQEIRAAFDGMVKDLGFASATAIPISARFGDNITSPSLRTPWYDGPTMLDYLESVDVSDTTPRPFRMPVQLVSRPDHSFRGYAGTVATGAVRPGDRIAVASSGVGATVKRIVTMDGDRDVAEQGDAVTLVLAEEVDISRGDVVTTGDPVAVTDRFDANLVWLSEAPLYPSRAYLLKLGAITVAGTVTRILHRVDINTYEHTTADTLKMNDVAHVSISLGTAIAVEAYAGDKDLGGFILIDRLTNSTVAVGMVTRVADTGGNIVWQKQEVGKAERAGMKHQQPATLWFTGLSGAGKSTIANLVEQKLHAIGRHTFMLDGDNVRHGLNRDLGFTEADRIENIRRAAEAAKLMVEAGLIVLVSFISPYRSDRDAARELHETDEFLEIFVDTPVDECRRRDPKGLYKRADAGLIPNFTGVSAPYEAPLTPEIRLDTTSAEADVLAERVVEELRSRGLFLG